MIASRRPATRDQPSRPDTASHDAWRPSQSPDTRNAPIIVLTYKHSGAARLQSLLALHPQLVCTSGTGVLPLCEQAAAAWREVDGTTGALSALAVSSIRALTSTLIGAILSFERNRRWCETTWAAPESAETFLQLFHGTRILCLHRAFPMVVYDAVHSSPWGLEGGATVAPFIRAYPASTLKALTAYWLARTKPLLAFEQAHPGICRRVRYEDLSGGSSEDLFSFLGLDNISNDMTTRPAHEPRPHELAPSLPLGQIPPAMLEQANDLMRDLGYAPACLRK